jgi:ubiquinone/menaquinone biosynthesis C-methylase UbiE
MVGRTLSMQSERVEKDYSAVASEYERTRYGSFPAQFVSGCEIGLLRRAIVAHASSRRVLLDVACGTGHFTSQVADLFGEVVAMDFTHAMLARARHTLGRPELKRVLLLQASVAALPVIDGSCDVVLSTRFLHLFPRAMHREILEALLRPLRRGGVLIVDHDTRFVEWRGRDRLKADVPRHSYDSGETPRGARCIARLGVSGPRLPAMALKWPRVAGWLTRCFVYSPLNRVATLLVVVYMKQ